MEPWRAVVAHNGCVEAPRALWAWRVFRSGVADWHHFDEEQEPGDPDTISSKKSDPNLH
jgi:hypothetical protein